MYKSNCGLVVKLLALIQQIQDSRQIENVTLISLAELDDVTPLPREARGIVEQDRIRRHSTKRTYIAHTLGIHTSFYYIGNIT